MEWNEYKAATASGDPAAQENAANDFAARFPDSKLCRLLYKKAMHSYQLANNPDKMLSMARKILTLDSDDPEGLLGVAQVLAERTRETDVDKDQRVAEARKDVQRSLVTIDTDVPSTGYTPEQLSTYKGYYRAVAYAVLGDLAYDAKEWPEAETNLRKSIDSYPQQPAAFIRLSLALDMQNNYSEALKYANQAVELTKEGDAAGKVARQERDRLLALTASNPGGTNPAKYSGAQAASAASVPSPNNSQSSSFADVMTWFDEPAPGPTTEVREVVITAKAYDGVLNILRKLRDSDTSVKSGSSVLETGYHPPSFRLGASVPSKQSVQVFHWDDEVPTNESLVMHIRVTRRVYDNVSNAIGHLHVTTFSEP
jgi:tetratricopeptide (TPR) repeat protein